MSGGGGGGTGGGDEVVDLRPSPMFLVSAFFTPAVLVVLGAWGVLRAGELRLFPGALLLVGVALGAVVAADLPYRVELGSFGVDRFCVLRRHRVGWDDVVAVGRTRVERSGQVMFGRAVGGRSTKVGGLVLVVGPRRRRYLLTDRQERPDQFHQIQQKVPRWAPGVALPPGPPR